MTAPSRFHRWLWLGVAMLSLFAAGTGVIDPSVYDGLVPASIRPGVFTQDLVAVVVSTMLGLLAVSDLSHPIRKRVVAHGILGFLFYAYGIYAIERMYNALYPLYLVLFGGSLFVLIYSIAVRPNEAASRLMVPRWVRLLGAGYGLLIAVVFTVMWISDLVPLLQSGERIDHLYSIYIIDISFVMPAFAMAAVMTLRRHPVGLMGLPSLFIVGAGILSPLALAEWMKPIWYSAARDSGGLVLYGMLTIVFVALAGLFLATTQYQERDTRESSSPP